MQEIPALKKVTLYPSNTLSNAGRLWEEEDPFGSQKIPTSEPQASLHGFFGVFSCRAMVAQE